MTEHNVVTQLHSIADKPIDPSQGFADDLWRRLESELDSVGSPALQTKPVSDKWTSIDVSVGQSTVQRSRRSPAWAAAAAFALVLGVGLFVGWLLLPGPSDVANTDQTNAAFTAPGPVDLSAGDVLWPAQDMTGTPMSVAEAFAVEVLGWNRAAATETERGTCLTFPSRNTEVCPTDATTVTLAQVGVDPLELVLYTIGKSDTGELWAVAQVGSGYTADLLESVDTGARIPLPGVEGAAVQADITIRLADVDDPVEVRAGLAELEAGYVDTSLVSDPEQVLSVIIRYRDTNGHVISAAGGPWNEFYEWPEPAGPEVFIAEGTYQGSTVGWQMSAFNTTDGHLCIRISGMGCIGDISSGEHLGALLTDYSSFEAGQDARWCAYGTVSDADAVQLRLPDGTQTTASIYTNPGFDVDFYVFCGVGDQPANEVTALDPNGDIIDVIVIPYTTRN